MVNDKLLTVIASLWHVPESAAALEDQAGRSPLLPFLQSIPLDRQELLY